MCKQSTVGKQKETTLSKRNKHLYILKNVTEIWMPISTVAVIGAQLVTL